MQIKNHFFLNQFFVLMNWWWWFSRHSVLKCSHFCVCKCFKLKSLVKVINIDIGCLDNIIELRFINYRWKTTTIWQDIERSGKWPESYAGPLMVILINRELFPIMHYYCIKKKLTTIRFLIISFSFHL